jgi:catechol 2,3-dioxygenase-like lactoylglutathione lyase family enzyme
MAKLHVTRAAPSFAVADVFEAAEYYRDVLGFRFDRIWGNPPSFVMLERDDVVVMMKQVKPEALPKRASERSDEQVDMYLWVTNVLALADELAAKDADIVEGPVDRPIYNGRELIVRDLNGLIICFGQLLDENPD